MRISTSLVTAVVFACIGLCQAQITRPATTSATADIMEPSLVTLHFKKAPAREVYESLYQQAHATLKTLHDDLWQNEGKKLVTIDLDNVPFWTAMNELEAQTGLALRGFGDQSYLFDAQMGRITGPQYLSGPFMVVADETFGRNSFRTLQVFVEPRFHVVSQSRQPDIEEATDFSGEPVMSRNHRPDRDMDEISSNVFDIDLNLMEGSVAHVKGTVRVLLGATDQTIEIDNIATANNVEKKINGWRFIVNAINPEPGDWSIVLIAFNTNPPTPGLSQARIKLVDARGNALKADGHGIGSSEHRVDFDLRFHQDKGCGSPAKLTIQIPRETREVKIPFEFGKARGGGK